MASEDGQSVNIASKEEAIKQAIQTQGQLRTAHPANQLQEHAQGQSDADLNATTDESTLGTNAPPDKRTKGNTPPDDDALGQQIPTPGDESTKLEEQVQKPESSKSNSSNDNSDVSGLNPVELDSQRLTRTKSTLPSGALNEDMIQDMQKAGWNQVKSGRKKSATAIKKAKKEERQALAAAEAARKTAEKKKKQQKAGNSKALAEKKQGQRPGANQRPNFHSPPGNNRGQAAGNRSHGNKQGKGSAKRT